MKKYIVIVVLTVFYSSMYGMANRKKAPFNLHLRASKRDCESILQVEQALQSGNSSEVQKLSANFDYKQVNLLCEHTKGKPHGGVSLYKLLYAPQQKHVTQWVQGQADYGAYKEYLGAINLGEFRPIRLDALYDIWWSAGRDRSSVLSTLKGLPFQFKFYDVAKEAYTPDTVFLPSRRECLTNPYFREWIIIQSIEHNKLKPDIAMPVVKTSMSDTTMKRLITLAYQRHDLKVVAAIIKKIKAYDPEHAQLLEAHYLPGLATQRLCAVMLYAAEEAASQLREESKPCDASESTE